MAYSSFRQFIDTLDQAGELKRIATPVDTDLVISEWANREMKSPGGGKALLFEHPVINGEASKFPVAINTMGSDKRMAMALRVNAVEDIAQEIQLILKAKPPTDLREGWTLLKQGIHLLHARPKHVRDAACQEVVEILDPGPSILDKSGNAHPTSSIKDPVSAGMSLGHLPILKCWPNDGGRFITLPNVHTRDPETGARMLVFIGCRSSMIELPPCIGRCTKSERGTANVTTNGASPCRSQ